MRRHLVSLALLATVLTVGAQASAGPSQTPLQRSQRAAFVQKAGPRTTAATAQAAHGASESLQPTSTRLAGPRSWLRAFGRTKPQAIATRGLSPLKASVVAADLSPHATPLMTKIFHAVDGAEHHGTIANHLVTADGHAEHEVLLGGPQGFERMASLIANAKHEVLLQSYVWQKSDVGDTLLGALPKLQENVKNDTQWHGKPVEVRLLLNERRVPGMQSLAKLVTKLPGKLAKEADRAVSIRETLGKDVEALKLDPRYVRVTIATHNAELLGSLHSKTLTVDAHTLVSTGMNVQRSNDDVTSDGQAKPFAMDATFVFHGAEIGEAARADFEHGWTASTGAALPKAPAVSSTVPAGASPKVPMLVVTRKADGNPFSAKLDTPHNRAFVAATDHTTNEVRIMTPNLNDAMMRESIVNAVKRGTTVKIILGKGFNDVGERFAGGTNDRTVERIYSDLRKSGVSNPGAKLQIRWYSADGKGPTPATLDERAHLKYASFDGKVAIVGSGNMDEQSFRHSQEINVVVDSADVTKKWDTQVFEPAFARSAPVSAPSSAKAEAKRSADSSPGAAGLHVKL